MATGHWDPARDYEIVSSWTQIAGMLLLTVSGLLKMSGVGAGK